MVATELMVAARLRERSDLRALEQRRKRRAWRARLRKLVGRPAFRP